MSPSILPLPRKVKPGEGRFDVGRSTPVVLSPSCDAADRFAAGILREEIDARASIELSVEKHGRTDGLGRHILLLRLADCPKKGASGRAGAGAIRRAHDARILSLSKGAGGFPLVKGAGEAAKIGTEGYLVEVTPERVVVAANTSAGIFYGVQTLCQALDAKPGRANFPAMSITDYPQFRYRGVMLDICRGRVPTLKTLFGLVEYLASMKVNCLQFHTEHTFAFRRHRDIGKNKGSLSPENIMRLVEHAKLHHLELQANLQCFGHMSNILSLPRYKDLAESEREWSVAPARRETYEFLDDLLSEYLPCFEAKVFNANCDEVYDLGEGRSRKLVERRGAGRVYADHMKKVRALAGKYGKRLAMWADYVLKYPETLKLLPKDVILINWGYAARHDFNSTGKIARAGFEHWVAPGTGSWSALFPRIEVACRNIAGFAAAGVRYGATGLLNTDWGDGGHPNMLGASFHGFAYGAEVSWSGPSKDPADFDKRFAWALVRDKAGLLGKAFRMLGGTNAAFGVENYRSVPFRLYWAEFPDGIDRKSAEKGFSEAQLKKAERAAWKARSHIAEARRSLPASRPCLNSSLDTKLLLGELDFAARQTLFACQKARLAVRIQKAMPKERGKASLPEAAWGFGGMALPEELMKEVEVLLREWRIHRDEFERLWRARSRQSEIELRLRLYKTREQEFARLATPPDEGC